MALAVKFREELSRLGLAVVNEFDNFAAYINSIGLLIASDIYYAEAVGTTAQSVPNGIITQLSIYPQYDPYGMVQNSSIKIPKDGVWDLRGNLFWAAAAGGALRVVYIYTNGSRNGQFHMPPNGAQTVIIQINRLIRLTAGTTVDIRGYQDSGGALNVGGVAVVDVGVYLTAKWVRP